MFDCSLKELIIPLRGIKGKFLCRVKNLLKEFMFYRRLFRRRTNVKESFEQM
nr:MAG TPA: hypothetical protein [Caudoviricetes sp.]